MAAEQQAPTPFQWQEAIDQKISNARSSSKNARPDQTSRAEVQAAELNLPIQNGCSHRRRVTTEQLHRRLPAGGPEPMAIGQMTFTCGKNVKETQLPYMASRPARDNQGDAHPH